MTTTESFINSPIFIALLSAALTIVGVLLKMLWSALIRVNERIQTLEISTNDLANVKASISGIGFRTGELESQSLLHSSNHNQLSEIIKEIRADAKDTSQMLSDMYGKINQISIALAVLSERTGSDRKDNHN